ncbi:MAG: TrkH family potassium uptake protein [Phycisphaerales bacterium]
MNQRQFIKGSTSGVEAFHWLLIRLFAALAANVVTLLEVGFYDPIITPGWTHFFQALFLCLIWIVLILAYLTRKNRRVWIRSRVRELVLLSLATLSVLGRAEVTTLLLVLLLILYFVRVYVVLAHMVVRPGLMFLSSFILMIVAGAILLRLPRATPPGDPISTLDSFFTATSSVCVTGLIVRDTATEFTRFGQVIILTLIQLGGLGIVIFGALFATMLGGSLSLRHAASVQEVVRSAEGGIADIDRLVRFVVVATLLTEAVGALLLYPAWPQDLAAGERVFLSVFVSISSFCNAGFAPFTNSLVNYRYEWAPHLVVAPLIVLGGLGFPALFNLWQVFYSKVQVKIGRKRRRRGYEDRIVRINLHTKIVISTTLALYLFGVVAIMGGQLSPYLHEFLRLTDPDAVRTLPTLDGPQVWRHTLDASFMSITARTAGFNTLPMEELTPSSQFVLMLLMWVGGSPGSTAGGVKTVAIAVLLITIWATVRGRRETEAFGRSIPDELVRRAGVLVMLGFFTVAATTYALTITEAPALAEKIFESVSAVSTVGLTLDYTDDLTPAGRLIIIFAMFLGRVGPLVMLGTLAFGASGRARYRYPAESVVMG